MPSMVRMSPPSTCRANTVQLFTDLPSRSTVQAPQWLVSQPTCGPVRLSFSRRKWISRVRGSTNSSTGLPFTLRVMWDLAIWGLPEKLRTSARLGAGQRTREHHAGHLGAVLRRAAAVGGRRGDRLGGGNGFLYCGGVERRAVEDPGGLLGP